MASDIRHNYQLLKSSVVSTTFASLTLTVYFDRLCSGSRQLRIGLQYSEQLGATVHYPKWLELVYNWPVEQFSYCLSLLNKHSERKAPSWTETLSDTAVADKDRLCGSK